MSEPTSVQQDLEVGFVRVNNRSFKAVSVAAQGLALQLRDAMSSKPGYLQGVSVLVTSVDPSNLGKGRSYEERDSHGQVQHKGTEFPFEYSSQLTGLAAKFAPGMIGIAKGVGFVLRVEDGVSKDILEDTLGLSEYHLISQKKGIPGLWHRFQQLRLPPISGKVSIPDSRADEYFERVKVSMNARPSH